MRQENLNNKIKDLFSSMDDYDQKEALTRKEDVWQAVHPYKEKKKGRQWLLILLLCSLFFGAGWFLKYKNTTPAESPKIEQQDKILPTKTNQLPIAQMKMKLNFKEQQLDSLMEVNRILSAELTALDDRSNAVNESETKNNTIYVRDTFYIVEVKVEQQLVERIIKDTILIEVPVIEKVQATMMEASVAESKKNGSNNKTEEKTETPTSIQFNFSESNLKDN